MITEQTNKVFDSKKILEKVLLEFRIRLNKELYEEGLINFDVYQTMEGYLIKKISGLSKKN